MAALNFVPPTSADGYLDVHSFNQSVLGPVIVHIPLRFATRSTDPNAYPTACVTVDTNVLDQPGGKLINRVDKGNAVTVLKSSNGWSQILIYLFEAEPNVGWVPSSDLTTDVSGLTEVQLMSVEDAKIRRV